MKVEDTLNIVLFCMGLLFGAIVSGSLTASYWRLQAIKHGKANFVLTSPETDKAIFQWKP